MVEDEIVGSSPTGCGFLLYFFGCFFFFLGGGGGGGGLWEGRRI
jgi:hypothetical protein